MNPDLVLKQGDPIAEVLNEDFPSVVMPNLGLGPADAEDLLSYLKAADMRLAFSEDEAAAAYAAYEEATGGVAEDIPVAQPAETEVSLLDYIASFIR